MLPGASFALNRKQLGKRPSLSELSPKAVTAGRAILPARHGLAKKNFFDKTRGSPFEGGSLGMRCCDMVLRAVFGASVAEGLTPAASPRVQGRLVGRLWWVG